MKVSAYDRCLISLAWLAPLSLLVLNRWQTSFDHWYAPMSGSALGEITTALSQDAKPWLATLDGENSKLYLIIDPDCPCTEPAVRKVQDEFRKISRIDMALHVVPIADPVWASNPKWRSVLKNLPSTPSLIAVEGNQMVYVGPAVSGSLCGTTAKVVGIPTLQSRFTSPAINIIDSGCYCPVAHS